MELLLSRGGHSCPLPPRTERILKRTSIGVSIVVGFADLLILGFFAWFLVYFPVLKEDTLYSPGYSEAGFDQVKAGMTEPEVKDLLGLPLRVIEESNGRHKRMIDYDGVKTVTYPDLSPGSSARTTGIIYYYTQPGNGTADWYVRAVTFTPQWVVSKVRKSYYVD